MNTKKFKCNKKIKTAKCKKVREGRQRREKERWEERLPKFNFITSYFYVKLFYPITGS